MRLTFIALALSGQALAAGGDQAAIEQAQTAVTRELTDPGSAQFRDVFAYAKADKWIVCGEINAKNKFGGYVGFKRFYVSDGRPGLDDGNAYFPILFDALCAEWIKSRP